MSKHTLILLFSALILTGAPAFAKKIAAPQTADAPTDPNKVAQTQALLMTATLKMNDALIAKLNGDAEKRLASLKAAIEAYDGIIADNPEHIVALHGRGLCKEEIATGEGAADLETVVTLTTAQITQNPTDAAAYHARAKALRSLKRFDAAISDYKRAIETYTPTGQELMDVRKKWEMDLKATEIEAR